MKFVDTKIYQILEKAFDIIYINFLFVVFSLPVITIFPSLLAAIYALSHNPLEGQTIIKKFLYSFWKYVRKSILVSILIIVLIGVDVLFYISAINTGSMIYLILATIVVFETIILIVGLAIGYIKHDNCTLSKRYLNAIIVGHMNLINVGFILIVIGLFGFLTFYLFPLFLIEFALMIFLVQKMNLKWSDLDDNYYISQEQ